MVAVLEALRDALLTREESSAEVNRDGSRKVDRRHFERPEWLLEEVINGYQFSTAVLQILEGTPRLAGNRLATFETPNPLRTRYNRIG